MNESHTTAMNAVPATRPWRNKILDNLPALNVSMSWFCNIVVTVGSFVVTPATLYALGDNQYGTWLLITSFVGHMRILDLGMTSGCMKYSAGAYERGDRPQLLKYFHTSVAIFTGAAVLALLGTAVLTLVLPHAYAATLSGAQAVIVMLGLSVVIDLLFRPFAASLRARSLFFVYDGLEIITYLVFKLGLVLYLSHTGLTLWLLCLISLGEAVVRNLFILAITMRLCNWTSRPNPARADRATMMTLAGFSGVVFLISLADLFRFQISAAMIGHFMPFSPDRIAVYGIGWRLIGLAAYTIGVVGAVLIPRFSGLYERGAHDEIMALLRKANLATGLLTAFTLVSITVFGHGLLKLWIGKPWIDESYLIMYLAMPATFIALLQGPASGMLTGSGRLKWQAVITVGEAIFNFTLCMLLIEPLGIYGVCLATAIPMLIVRGVIFPLIIQHELKINFFDYYRMHTKTALVTVLYAIAVAGFSFLEYNTFGQFFAACTASTLIFGVILWCCIPEAREIGRNVFERIKA